VPLPARLRSPLRLRTVLARAEAQGSAGESGSSQVRWSAAVAPRVALITARSSERCALGGAWHPPSPRRGLLAMQKVVGSSPIIRFFF
jgi:hypothetical protein